MTLKVLSLLDLVDSTVLKPDIAPGILQPRSATLVVAAVNALAASKAIADYVCDGTNDEVEITAAGLALSAGGGKIALTEGSFSIAGPITINQVNVHIEGMGPSATHLRVANAAGSAVNGPIVALNQSHSSVSNLSLDGNRSNNAAQTNMVMAYLGANYGRIQNVAITNSPGLGIVTYVGAFYARVLDCRVENCAGTGINARAPSNGFSIVHGCYAITCATGFLADLGSVTFDNCVAISSSAAGFHLADTGCQARNCVAIANVSYGFQMAGSNCQVVGSHSRDNANAGFYIAGGTNNQVIGCESVNNLQGIFISGGSRHVAQSNHIINSGQYGIYSNVAEVQIIGNKVVDSSAQANNATVAVLVAGNDSYVSGNMVRRGAGANRATYGLHLVTGSNIYVGANDLYDSGSTGIIFDQATNTRRISKAQLNYTAGVVLNGASIPAGGWTTIVTGQTFRVDSVTSRILVTVRCSILLGITASSSSFAMRVVIDAVTPYQISGDRNSFTNDYTQLAGGSVPIYGLTGGTNHSITLQVYTDAAATGYCRALNGEFIYIDIEEFQR